MSLSVDELEHKQLKLIEKRTDHVSLAMILYTQAQIDLLVDLTKEAKDKQEFTYWYCLECRTVIREEEIANHQKPRKDTVIKITSEVEIP